MKSVTFALIALLDEATDKKLRPMEVRLDRHSHMELVRERDALNLLDLTGAPPTFRGLPIITEHRRARVLLAAMDHPVGETEELPPIVTVITLGCRERGEHGRWVYLEGSTK